MAEQVSKLDVAFRDDVSAGAQSAADAIRKVGAAAEYSEERVTRATKSGAALASQYGEQERLASKIAAIQKRYAQDLEDVERSNLDAAKAEELRGAIQAQQAIAIQKATVANQHYINGLRAMDAAANQNVTANAAVTATYRQTMAAIDPAERAMQQYAAAMTSVTNYHTAAGSSADALATDLNKLAAAYDPLVIAANKRTQAIYAEMDALQQSIALAKEEVRARQAQDQFNGLYAPGLSSSSSARDSASVFAEEFAAQDRIQREMEETAAAERQLIATRQQMRAQYDPLYAAQLRYEKQLEQISKALEMQAIDEQLAARARTAAEASFKQQTQEVARGTAGMGRFSMAVGQGGLQMQDLAVQVMGGTNAFVALGQQLPQFLGIFGTGGAIAGAVIAVGALAANMLTLSDNTAAAARRQRELLGDFNKWTDAVDTAIDRHDAFAKVLERVKKIQEDLPELSRQSAESLKAETANIMAAARARVLEAEARVVARQTALELEKGAANDTMSGTNTSILDQVKNVEVARKRLTGMRIELDLLRAAAGEFAGERGLGLLNDGLNGTGKAASVAEGELEKAKKRAQDALSQLQGAVANSDRILANAIQRQREGQQVTEGVRNVWERWADEQDRLNGLLRTGAINMDTFNRAMLENPAYKAQDDLYAQMVDTFERNLADKTREIEVKLVAQFNAQLETDDITVGLRKAESEIDRLGRWAAQSVGYVLTSIAEGDWDSVSRAMDDFMADFKQLSDETFSASDAFDKLAESVLNSADAGRALGDLVGEIFGRSEAQQKNAKIGETVAGTVGDFFGVPKGLSRFIGNVIGGLFGPGKSDATAGVQVYTRDDRVQNFDTDASKQDSGNMSARDALAQSVMQYTNLLETIGGQISSVVAIEVGSRDGNRWRVTDQNGQIVNSGVTAVGDIEGTLSQVLAAITNTLTGVDEELQARLRRVDFSDLERAESDVNFILNYDMAIQKMNGTLEGGADAVETARQQVLNLRSEVEDFSTTAGRLGFDTATTADALRASVERFAGIGAAVPQMTEIEIQVAALAASFAELAPVLELVGYNATEAATAVQQAEAARMASLRASVSGAQDARYNELVGNSFVNDIRSLIATRDTDIRDALAVGLSDSGAIRNFQAALAGVLTADLRTDQLQEALRLFGDMPDVVTAANAALAAVNNGLDGTAKAARSAADIANERAGLEVRLLQAQGDTVALRAREREALDESNRAIYDQVQALENQKQATEAAAAAATASANITRTLEERVLAIATNGAYDASIRMLEKRQQLEFLAAQTSGYAADQLVILADVLAGEMVLAVDALNRETISRSENLTIRALRAQAANEGLSQATRDAISAQALQIERNRELAEAISEEERAVLRAIYAYEDQATAATKAAAATQSAADALDRLRDLGGGIRQWIDQIQAGGLEGYLSPQQRLANADTQFRQQLTLAQGGNEDALRGITGYADRLFEAQKAVTGSSGVTQARIQETLAALGNLPAVKSYDQQQLELLSQIAANTNLSRDAIRVEIGEEVARTVNIVNVAANLSADQKALALLATGEVSRTISLLAGQTALTDQQIDLALLATQSVSKAINLTVTSTTLTTDQTDMALLASGSVQRTINIAITDAALTTTQRDVLFGASQSFARALQLTVASPTLTVPARDLLLGSSASFSRVMELAATAGSGLSDAQRDALLSGATRISRTIELAATQPAGLTVDQKALLDAEGGTIQRTIAQALTGNSLTDDQRNALTAVSGTIQRVIDQRVTVSGTVLTAEALSANIALEIGNVAFAGQALANRYLAAIAMNTARAIGVGGGGVWATDDPNMAGDQAIYETRSAALLNVPAGGGGGPNDGYLPYLASIHSVLAGFSASLNVGGFMDKIRHNTAETVARLGGYASYDVGTDFHPGGAAMVHAGELLLPPSAAPRGMKVLTARETAELMRPARITVAAGRAGEGAANSNGWAVVAAKLESLERTVVAIANDQASQQAAESRDQIEATHKVANAMRSRRPQYVS